MIENNDPSKQSNWELPEQVIDAWEEFKEDTTNCCLLVALLGFLDDPYYGLSSDLIQTQSADAITKHKHATSKSGPSINHQDCPVHGTGTDSQDDIDPNDNDDGINGGGSNSDGGSNGNRLQFFDPKRLGDVLGIRVRKPTRQKQLA